MSIISDKGVKILRVAFYTLGCKVNQYETQVIRQRFESDGFDIVSSNDISDIYIVNSCTVTANGDRKTRQMIRRFRRNNPNAIIALIGCFPQAFPEDAQILNDADVIIGTQNKSQVLNLVKEHMASGKRIVSILPHENHESFEKMSVSTFYERTRAFIKIQDGCERHCSYCIIPTARGPIRSKPIAELEEELKELANSGYKEVVLVGINLSCYGLDIGLRLIDAIRIACSIDGIERVRLGSIEPELLSDEDIISLANLDKLCDQFHLSLQSGCDATLKRMNRHYTANDYAELVGKLRSAFPNAAITTDIMVGFPGETAEEFEESRKFAEEIAFAKAHVFAYSIRGGTPAATLPNQILQSIKEQRSTIMIDTVNSTRETFLQTQVGQTYPVLFETISHDGWVEGYTPNYSPVKVKNLGEKNDLPNSVLYVKIVEATEEFCIGVLD